MFRCFAVSVFRCFGVSVRAGAGVSVPLCGRNFGVSVSAAPIGVSVRAKESDASHCSFLSSITVSPKHWAEGD